MDLDSKRRMTLTSYLRREVTRGYQLEHDEERYADRREKMYTFMKIPRELEKFMSYGFFHCVDSFLFVFTFLPIRFFLACAAFFWRIFLSGFFHSHPNHRMLLPAEIIDLLKGLIIALCVYAMLYLDTSVMYHIIKSQSVIKLYLFYNMLEVGDRLFSAFGQDTIDALFWTATEPRNRKRETIGVIPHFVLAVIYVSLHSTLVLLQATTLNVAINASNKALLTIMMSNNFVELKGAVFKKFDKTNLFQVSCSDVRERFHLFALLFIVVVQTMKEYGWKEESFWSLTPDCLLVLAVEFVIDWVKHAFITRFNEMTSDVYKDYTTSLAYDLAQSKAKHAFSDHSDLVSRRMGFIPLPLGVVMIRVIGSAVRFNGPASIILLAFAFLCLVTFRVLGSIVILGKACDLIDQHQSQSKQHRPFPMSNDEDVSDRADVDLNTSVASNLNDMTYVESTPLPSSTESERTLIRQRNQGIARDIFESGKDENGVTKAGESRRISQTEESANSSDGTISEAQQNSRDESTGIGTTHGKSDSTAKSEAKVVLNDNVEVIGIPDEEEDDIPLTPLDGFMPIEIRMGLFPNSSVKLSCVKMAPELGVHDDDDDDDSPEEAGSNVEELGSVASIASFTIGPPTRRTMDKVRRTISCSVDKCCDELRNGESLPPREPFQLDPEDEVDPELERVSSASASHGQTESSATSSPKTAPVSTQLQPQSSSSSSVCSSPFRMRSLSSPDLVQGASGGSDNDWPTIDDEDGDCDVDGSALVQQPAQPALAASATTRASSARNNSAPTPSTIQPEATMVPLSRSNDDIQVQERKSESSEAEVTGD